MDNAFNLTKHLVWHKASKSSGAGQCVEVAWSANEGVFFVRDTKTPNLPPQGYTPGEWEAFIDGVKKGEFDVEVTQNRLGSHSKQAALPVGPGA